MARDDPGPRLQHRPLASGERSGPILEPEVLPPDAGGTQPRFPQAPRHPGGSWVARGVARLALAIFGGLLAFAFRGVRSSWAYREGVALARRDPRVREVLGAPLTTGWLFSGSINVAGPRGSAGIAVPLRGPKAAGTLHVKATKAAGAWRFDLAQVTATGRRIDLLHEQ